MNPVVQRPPGLAVCTRRSDPGPTWTPCHGPDLSRGPRATSHFLAMSPWTGTASQIPSFEAGQYFVERPSRGASWYFSSQLESSGFGGGTCRGEGPFPHVRPRGRTVCIAHHRRCYSAHLLSPVCHLLHRKVTLFSMSLNYIPWKEATTWIPH